MYWTRSKIWRSPKIRSCLQVPLKGKVPLFSENLEAPHKSRLFKKLDSPRLWGVETMVHCFSLCFRSYEFEKCWCTADAFEHNFSLKTMLEYISIIIDFVCILLIHPWTFLKLLQQPLTSCQLRQKPPSTFYIALMLFCWLSKYIYWLDIYPSYTFAATWDAYLSLLVY